MLPQEAHREINPTLPKGILKGPLIKKCYNSYSSDDKNLKFYDFS